MSILKPVNIYVGNHLSLDGIKDILQIIIEFFNSSDVRVEITSSLDPKKINIVIDEFFDLNQVNYIHAFKHNYPTSKLILILTEFVGPLNKDILSFNPYMNKLDRILTIIYVKNLPKIYKNILLRSLNKFFLNFIIKNFRSIGRNIYNYHRYLGFERALVFFDAFISIDFAVEQNVREFFPNLANILAGSILPQLKVNVGNRLLEKFDSNSFLFSVTTSGSKTKFRNQIFRKISKMFLKDQSKISIRLGHYGFRNSIYQDMFLLEHINKQSNVARSDKRLNILRNNIQPSDVYEQLFSLHVAQDRYWKKVSPTRIYRSIMVDLEVPILYGNYETHRIQKICVTVEKQDELLKKIKDFHSSDETRKKWIDDLQEYEKFFFIENQKTYQRLLKLLGFTYEM